MYEGQRKLLHWSCLTTPCLQVPKTCENFRCLVDGSKGLGKASKKPLHYKVSIGLILRMQISSCIMIAHAMTEGRCLTFGHWQGCKFHRIVKGFCCQGGDVVRGAVSRSHHAALINVVVLLSVLHEQWGLLNCCVEPWCRRWLWQ